MARVTVEDCIQIVPNKFELVLLASKRAKDIDRGAIPSLPKDNDKPTIIALREIAEETISINGLREIAKKSIIEEIDNVFNVNEDASAEINEEELAKDFLDDDEDLENEDIIEDVVDEYDIESEGLTEDSFSEEEEEEEGA